MSKSHHSFNPLWPSSFLQITRKNLKLTSPENLCLFLDSSTNFQKKKSNILSDPPFEALFEKVFKKSRKKVAESKMSLIKVVENFTN